MTLLALNTVQARSPSFSPMSSRLSAVTTALMLAPPTLSVGSLTESEGIA